MGASKAGEAGVSVWEQDDELDQSEDEGPLGNPNDGDPTVESKDFALSKSSTLAPHQTTSEPLLLPSGAFQELRPAVGSASATPFSRAKRLKDVIRLQMTLNIITEKMQGPEVAMVRQQELFAFFSGRSGKGKALTGTTSATSIGEKGLGGSFVSIDQPNARDPGPSIVSGEFSLSCSRSPTLRFMNRPIPKYWHRWHVQSDRSTQCDPHESLVAWRISRFVGRGRG